MKIGIIGGGIAGLTTGVVFAEAGHGVEILTREPIQKTTSYAAAAICYPASVEDSARTNGWFARTNAVLETLLADQDAGVSQVDWYKYGTEAQYPKPSWMDYTGGEVRVLDAQACPEPYRFGIFAHLCFMNVDVYCAYMLRRFETAGGRYAIQNVEAPESVAQDYDVLVNATGVFAGAFVCDREVRPARGQVVVVENPGLEKHFSVFDSKNYIYPRGGQCVLGGSYDAGEWSMEPDDALTQDILKWAAGVEPALAGVRVLGARVGLRPLRPEVRLEKEVLSGGIPLIHNYGHGGAGYTLSWGCAEEVLKIAESL
jgi:D-amino-acid oxidase